MIEIVKKIISNVLLALYQPFVFAVLMAILFMFLYLFAKEKGWRCVVAKWIGEFKKEKRFRAIFLFVFYSTLILFRTLLNRNVWFNPISNVIGVWGLHNENGEFTTEIFENMVLFIPFVVLMLYCYADKIVGSKITILKTLWQSVKIVFLFSLSIEFMQLFLRLGTFQLSDLFYNTLGGFLGGLLYLIGKHIYLLICKKNDKTIQQ